MKIYRGREKIGRIEGKYDLYIDFNDLFYFKGRREFIHKFQKLFGSVLILVSSLVIAMMFSSLGSVNLFGLVDNELNNNELMIGISVVTLLYGLYFLRNRNKFGERLEPRNLSELEAYEMKNNGVEIENFFTDEVISIIEAGYKFHNNHFLHYLIEELFKNHKLRKIFNNRTEINLARINTNSISKDADFDSIFRELFLGLFTEGLYLDSEQIDIFVLFSYISKRYLVEVLAEHGVDTTQIEAMSEWISNKKRIRSFILKWWTLSFLKPKGTMNRAFTSKVTHIIDKYAEDYTNKVINGGFFLSIGKTKEIKDILNILSKEKDPNVLIHSNPGVGKSSVLKHIATLMVVEEVPEQLRDMRLIVLDINRILAVNNNADEFLSTIEKILSEAKNPNIILAFENIDYAFNMRADLKGELLNMIVSFVSDSNTKVIFTSNTDSYLKTIKQNASFGSLFEVIEIPEPNTAVTLQILLEQVDRIGKKNRIKVLVSGAEAISNASKVMIYEKFLPDKALDILENVVIFAKSKQAKFIDKALVDDFIKEKIGNVAVTMTESERLNLSDLEEILHKRVIGQDNAISAVASAVRRARSGLKDPKKPIASFLFYGPTGVGKTLVAKTLTDAFYGHESKMIRLDMSEFHDESATIKLIGGTDSNGNIVGGFLTEEVRRKPFSLILLDELEKANKKILDLLLTALDEGYIIDGNGREIDFKNTIIIATSNAASREITEMFLERKSIREIQSRSFEYLKDHYRLEFLNRFSKIIMFKPLNALEIKEITNLMLDNLNDKLNREGYIIKWDELTLRELVEIGYSPTFGARQIDRTIIDHIEDPISDLIIRGKFKKGQTLVFKGLEISDIL